MKRSRPSPLAWVQRGLAVAVLMTALIIFAGPFLWSLSLSFQEPGDVFRWPIDFWPDPATTRNYARLFTEIGFSRWLFNSVAIAVIVTASNLFFDSLAGYAFARMRFPGRDLLFAAFLATLMIPTHITLVPKFMLLNQLGMINSYGGLMLPNLVQVFGIFLMRQYFRTLPRELEEAARLDGCGPFKTFWRVAMPLSRAPLVALGIYSFQANWNDFLWPVIVTTTPDMYTLPVGMAMFRYEFQVEWTVLMAGSILVALPMLIVFLTFQRLFIQSNMASGMKD